MMADNRKAFTRTQTYRRISLYGAHTVYKKRKSFSICPWITDKETIENIQHKILPSLICIIVQQRMIACF